MSRKWWLFLPVLFLSFTDFAWAADGHADPVAPILLGLVILLLSGTAGAFAAHKLHQPAVLGELVAGVILGNLILFNIDAFEFIKTTETFDMMARIGVILLLFEVGLETSVSELIKVGLSSFLVAMIGVIAPFFLGWWVSDLLLPNHSLYVHLFIGATLCATSVGITARVLKDLKQIHLPESKIILGAAVVDDVLGLIILAVITGIITAANSGAGAEFNVAEVFIISGKAFGFLILALVVGARLTSHWFKIAGKLIVTSLSVCFLLSYFANAMGLAAIVGAFAAGLIIDGHAIGRYFPDADSTLEEGLLPISRFFVPLFFVLMGMMVDLRTFSDINVVWLAGALSITAIIGKQLCSLGALEKGLNRVAIGIGMVPRGEVGLIFASIGAGLVYQGENIIDRGLYSAIVIMVMVTTMITPPLLKWTLGNEGASQE